MLQVDESTQLSHRVLGAFSDVNMTHHPVRRLRPVDAVKGPTWANQHLAMVHP